MIKGQVLGLKELERALLALPREIAGKNGGPLRTGLRAAAKVIHTEVKARAPVDTGRLQGAIVIQRDRHPGNVSERFVIRPRRGRSRSDPKGAFFWHFPEFGTEKQPAQPYLRPGFDATHRNALEAFKVSCGRAIVAAAKRVARLRGG